MCRLGRPSPDPRKLTPLDGPARLAARLPQAGRPTSARLSEPPRGPADSTTPPAVHRTRLQPPHTPFPNVSPHNIGSHKIPASRPASLSLPAGHLIYSVFQSPLALVYQGTGQLVVSKGQSSAGWAEPRFRRPAGTRASRCAATASGAQTRRGPAA